MKYKRESLFLGLWLAALSMLGAVPASGQFNNPNGITFDKAGNLWLANAGGNNVLEMELSCPNATVVNTISNGVDDPSRLAFDSSGKLWVADKGNNTITVYNDLGTPGANLYKTITSSSIAGPLGIVVDAYGDFYVANNCASCGSGTYNVVAFNINDGLVETLTKDNSGFAFDSPGVLAIHGQDIYAGFYSGSDLTKIVIAYNVGEFLTKNPKEITVYNDNVDIGPTGIAFDDADNVYISEYVSQAWTEFSAAGTLLLAVRGASNGLNGPEGIALDSSGNVYVSNSGGNNITEYNSAGTLTCTYN
jgi:streptogramin lyase